MPQKPDAGRAQTTTLTSLSILKVDIDEGSRDYIDYLGAFVTEVLAIHRPEIVTDALAVNLLGSEFGLRIPLKAVQQVLRRLAKQEKSLSLRDGAYFLNPRFPAPTMQERRADANRKICAVISRLCDFSREIGNNPEWTIEHATAAITAFLGNFAIDCLRTYVFNTVLPSIPEAGPRENYVVGRFVKAAYEGDPALFNDFIVLVKGQMYANALTCPDLQSLQQRFSTLTCYLDTPVVLNLLGLHGAAFQAAAREMVDLVRDLSGSVAVFHHTVQETIGVLNFALTNLENMRVTNRTLREIRASAKQRSDVILLIGNIEDHLKELNARVIETPRYKDDYQIDEKEFGDALLDEINYLGAQALANDVNSIRSIYVKRQGAVPARLEDARAVLVTNNTAFAKTAYSQGRNHNSSREVSPVVTDYSLANVAWLKAPLKRPGLPETEMLALCYAGLEPSNALVEKYARTMEDMRSKGRISADDHALLRASAIAQSELMDLTLGDDLSLTEQKVSTILENAKAALVSELRKSHEEILREKDIERLSLERELEHERASASKMTEAHNRTRMQIANRAAMISAVVFGLLLIAASAALLLGAVFAGGIISPGVLGNGFWAKTGPTALALVAILWGWWNWLSGKTLGAALKIYEDRLARWVARKMLPE